MDPTISIVVPTYGRTEWLKILLRSLARDQSFSGGFEVIVVDDGSPDGDRKQKEMESESYPYPFRYLRQENQGPASARNNGFRHAQGKYIVFLDDDTEVLENWMREVIHGYEDPKIAGVVGETITYKTESLSERFLDHVRHLHSHQFNPDGSLAYICTANCSFRRNVLEEVAGFNEHLPLASGDDMDLGFRIKKNGYDFHYNPQARVFHRHRQTLAQMIRLFWISGRGAYMCAKLHQDIHTDRVTSPKVFEPGKVLRVLRDFFRKLWSNFKNPQLRISDALLFPFLELANHVFYQLGRLYEHFIARTLKKKGLI